MIRKLKDNWDIVLFVLVHIIIFVYLITGMQYFMLDLPTSMIIKKAYGLFGIFYLPQGTGRYWPLDPFFNALVTAIFGNNVLWQWIVHYLLFIALTILTWRNTFLCIQSRKKAFVAAITCVCATSMSENIFTIGKPELLLCVMFLLYINLIIKIYLLQKNQKLYYIILFFVSLLTYTCKETSVILIPISLLLVIFFAFVIKENKIQSYVVLGITVFTWFIYLFVKTSINNYYNITPTAYVTYSITLSSIIDALIYYFKYSWDTFLVGTVALVGNTVLFFKEKNYAKKRTIALILSMAGWGYIAGICLWQFKQIYYIYPAIVFFSMSLGIFLADLCKQYFLLVIGVAFLYGGWNGIIIADQTRDTSIIFSESMNYLLFDNKIKNKIYLYSNTIFDEPPYQMNILFKIFDKNLKVYGIKDIGEAIDSHTLELFGHTVESYEALKREVTIEEGSYILAYDYIRDSWVPSRRVNPIHSVSDIEKTYDEYMLERVAGDEMTKKRFTYSGIKNELCGWTIYRIIGDKRFITLQTDWTDWLGDDNTELEIDSQDYKYVVLEGAYEYDLGELNILCKSGDKIIPSEILIDKSLNRYKIVINIEGLNVDEMHIKLICDNYFVPAEELNLDDNRRLTLRYPEQIFLTNGLDYTLMVEE